MPVPAPAPAPAEALLDEARRLADLGRAEEARRQAQRYLERVPDSADAHFLLGVLGAQLHDVEAAATSLRRALYLDPDHYEALCHFALLAEEHGEHANASQLRRRAARVQARTGKRGRP